MVTLNTCYTLQLYTGLQADIKPLGVPNGSIFLEMDTGKLYRFDAQNQTWIDQANPIPSGGNDMFIVTITEDSGNNYKSDDVLKASSTEKTTIVTIAHKTHNVSWVNPPLLKERKYGVQRTISLFAKNISFRI